MAADRSWWPLKLQLLEVNYERCKLKVRQDSLYCKLSIAQLQNAFDEERIITQKYEKKAIAQQLQEAQQKVVTLANEKDFIAKKRAEDLMKVEYEWKSKTDKLVKTLESLQEEKKNELKCKDVLIHSLREELDALKSHQKESLVVENGWEPWGNEKKFIESEVGRETGALPDQSSYTTASHKPQIISSKFVKDQNSSEIVVEKSNNVSEMENDNGGMSEQYLGSDSLKKEESVSEQKMFESELGAVLEVTEDMLKSCRKRSVLKGKKTLGGVSHEGSNMVETNGDGSRQEKKRKERRVTFSGELEFKLPDGSEEVVEMEDVENSVGQMKTRDEQSSRGDDLPIFDDLLNETPVHGDEFDSEKQELNGGVVCEENEEEIAAFKMKRREENGEENEDTDLKKDPLCECVESEENADAERFGSNEKEEKDLKKKGKKKKGSNSVDKQENEEKNEEVKADDGLKQNGGEDSDDAKKMEDDKQKGFLVEADILLSADRQSQDMQLKFEDTSRKNSKTPSLEDEVKVKSDEKNSLKDELPHSQLTATGGRRGNNGPRRGLRQRASKKNDVRTSKRLLKVFGDEQLESKVVDDEETDGRKIAKKGNRKKSSKTIAENLLDAPSSNVEEDFKEARDNETEQATNCGEEAAFDNESEKAQKTKNTKKTRTQTSKMNQAMKREEETQKTKGKKTARKMTKLRKTGMDIGHEDESKRRGKRKRGRPAKRRRKSLQNDEDVEKNEEGERDVVQDCSPKQLPPTVSGGESTEIVEHGGPPLAEVNLEDEEADIVDVDENEMEEPLKENKVQNEVGNEDEVKTDELETRVNEEVEMERNNENKWGMKMKVKMQSDALLVSTAKKGKSSKEDVEDDNHDVTDTGGTLKGQDEGEPKGNEMKWEEVEENENGESSEMEMNNRMEGRKETKVAKRKSGDVLPNSGKKEKLMKRNEDEIFSNETSSEAVVKPQDESEEVVEKVDEEVKESKGRRARGRKRNVTEARNETEGMDDVKESFVKRATKHEKATLENMKQILGKIVREENPTKKKRRTLYNNRESSTFVKATSSIFQETLPLDRTRRNSGMPPSLNTFMQAFIVPKLKKK